MKSFVDKVAAITGAGSGIGRALAVALAERGCHLALSDVNAGGLAQTAALAARRGLTVTQAIVDVADRDRVLAWADEVVRDHGRCNLVFNNAGVAHASTAEGASPDDFRWIMSVNFWGVVHGTQAFLPHLRRSGDGHVINVSSLFGLVALAGHGTYNASKFAVRGYTEALRQELELSGAPVSVTCVHPGGVKTNIARASRVDDNLRELGVVPDASRDKFERLFRTTPESAAATILGAVARNRRRVLVGADAHLADLLQRLLPGSYHAVFAKLFVRALR